MRHIDALRLRLSNERIRLAAAATTGEKELRSVWIQQIEKEIAGEEKLLTEQTPCVMTDDELLAELEG